MRKLSYEEVKEFIEGEEGNGCKLLSTEYTGSRTKLKIQCACGEVFEKSFGNFKNNNQRQCSKCGISKQKLTYQDVKGFIEKNGFLSLI